MAGSKAPFTLAPFVDIDGWANRCRASCVCFCSQQKHAKTFSVYCPWAFDS